MLILVHKADTIKTRDIKFKKKILFFIYIKKHHLALLKSLYISYKRAV